VNTVPLGLTRALAQTIDITRAVETGTHKGAGARRLAAVFDEVTSIEVSPALHLRAQACLADLPHVTLLQGDSAHLLPAVVTRARASLYWLGGHWCEGGAGGRDLGCPLLDEIVAIRAGHPHDCVLIDDAFLFATSPPAPGSPGHWPELSDVLDALRSALPDHYVSVVEGVVIAVPRIGRPVVDAWGRGLLCHRIGRPSLEPQPPSDRRPDGVARLARELRRRLPDRLRRVGRRIRARKRPSLSRCESRVFSQNGEDGIVREILARIEPTPHWCVEIGTGSGEVGNCLLLAAQGWHSLLVESDPEQYRSLESRFAGVRHVRTLLATVTPANINGIVEAEDVPRNVGVVSIDVDGNDLWLWDALTALQPSLVVIEYNADLPADQPLTQPLLTRRWDGTDYFGASLAALERIGRAKGYELVHTDRCGVNAFFVRRADASRFPPRHKVKRRGRGYPAFPNAPAGAYVNLDQLERYSAERHVPGRTRR
jgi:predicted O-methyltransferase YrrM